MNDLTVLFRRIGDTGLDFVVVDGFAAVTHGSSYVTRDVDICAVLMPENVDRLRAALADLDLRHRLTPQRLSFLSHPPGDTLVSNLYLETRYGVVDVLTSVLGVGDFERLNRNAEELEVDGVRFRVMSLSDLITAKEALGREKDLLKLPGWVSTDARVRPLLLILASFSPLGADSEDDRIRGRAGADRQQGEDPNRR